MKKLPLLIAASLLLAACSWGIKLDSGGSRVRVEWNGDVGSCRQMGKIAVSVLDHVGPVDRRDLKVRDELEIMARNEAAGMGADTIKPLGDPLDGAQDWSAWHCGPRGDERRPPMRIEQKSGNDAVETYPVKEH